MTGYTIAWKELKNSNTQLDKSRHRRKIFKVIGYRTERKNLKNSDSELKLRNTKFRSDGAQDREEKMKKYSELDKSRHRKKILKATGCMTDRK